MASPRDLVWQPPPKADEGDHGSQGEKHLPHPTKLTRSKSAEELRRPNAAGDLLYTLFLDAVKKPPFDVLGFIHAVVDLDMTGVPGLAMDRVYDEIDELLIAGDIVSIDRVFLTFPVGERGAACFSSLDPWLMQRKLPAVSEEVLISLLTVTAHLRTPARTEYLQRVKLWLESQGPIPQGLFDGLED